MQAPTFRSVLVLGGARSGKTRFALGLAERSGGSPIYVATATAGDAEMAERIEAHRAERGPDWVTVEEPLELAVAVARHCAPGRVVLVDCLTLWLSNVVGAARDPEPALTDLAVAVAEAAGPLVLVSNEVGMGLVPETPLGRDFRDRQGRVNQRVGAACEAIVFVAAGAPMLLKPNSAAALALGGH